MVLGKLDRHMQKNETGPFPYTAHRNKPNEVKDLNVRQVSIQILAESTGSSLFDFSSSNFFLEK